MRHSLLLLFLLAVSVTGLYAQLRLPVLYDDHMVLQQQSPVPIWGWASTSQNIEIKVSWDTTIVRTKSDNTTFWAATLFTPVAGGPHTVTIKAGRETRTLTDVMVGEVWLCSGQSNMEWAMQMSGEKDMIDQVNDPNIRLFQVPKSAASTLQVRGEGDWKLCDKESVRFFSAVAYFFGKKLNKDLNVPIGLIHASWGGTPAETWVAAEKIEADPALKAAALKQEQEDRPWCPSLPGVVYNSMINPIIPFRLAGALWYQGESNTGTSATYKPLMEQLILDWREKFRSDFPFYYVQIAPHTYTTPGIAPALREQQTKMLSIPQTGMVVVSDLVDNVKDIHPRFKKPVGERLANIALSDTYGKKGIAYQSPIYKSMKAEKGKIRISFDYVLTGLMSKGGEPTEFLIAGEDKKFYPAKAKIEGNTVVVSAKEVKNPVAVRFGWRNDAMPNLFSKEGLPVSVFRTDDWDIGL